VCGGLISQNPKEVEKCLPGVFTARKDFDKDLGAKFTRLMLAMDGKDVVTEEVLKLESCSRWVPGSPEGFEVLLNAIQEEKKTPRK
jgi:hypothetical protein